MISRLLISSSVLLKRIVFISVQNYRSFAASGGCSEARGERLQNGSSRRLPTRGLRDYETGNVHYSLSY